MEQIFQKIQTENRLLTEELIRIKQQLHSQTHPETKPTITQSAAEKRLIECQQRNIELEHDLMRLRRKYIFLA